jgi:hypothetical protein
MERSGGAGDVNNKTKRAAERDASTTSRQLRPFLQRPANSPTTQTRMERTVFQRRRSPTKDQLLGHNDGARTPTVTLEDAEDLEREYEKVEMSSSSDQVDLAVAERLCLETTVPWAWDSARDYCKTFLSSLWDSRLNEGSAVGRSIRAARREASVWFTMG